ncbi:MAG: hypothetical protein ACTS2F_11585 [Thainema sp.]
MSLPLLISEQQVQPFNYYQDGAIFCAIAFQRKFYKRVCQFKQAERSKAYTVGYQFGEHGNSVVITASDTHYTLWVDVRADVAAIPIIEMSDLFRSTPGPAAVGVSAA